MSFQEPGENHFHKEVTLNLQYAHLFFDIDGNVLKVSMDIDLAMI